MAIKSGIVFAALILGCLALPKPEQDYSQFFEHMEASEGRIVGGTVAPVGSHPHMVAMTNGALVRNFLCGGSILSQRTVLTAAHCIAAVFSWGSLSGSLRVTVGTNRWNQGGVSLAVSSNATHPNYVSSTIKNDLGILYTSSNIVFTNHIRPISLGFEFVDANVQARAAGWGRIVHQGALSAQLIHLDLSTITGHQCVTDVARAAAAANMRAPAVEPHIELCTMHPRGAGHGTCNGDSGSALVRLDRGTQIGIVSWGIPCARGAPDMFVRVSAYQSWFAQHIRH